MPRSQSLESTRAKLLENKRKQKKYYNRSSKELQPLHNGDVVRVKPKDKHSPWRKGVVERQLDIRSYKIRTEDGCMYRRNRKHLRATKENIIDPDSQDLDPTPLESQPENIVPSETGKTHTAMNVHQGVENAKSSEKNITPDNYQTLRGRSVKKPGYLKDYIT
ncbi:hypothetical protein ACJMK2_014125 [Sinanodonta woodiana]|uniref:Uncharacterized protein n=1 Tax=Sinanodonta woodiana TaxID=1069815 RepID=A0ABD3UZQ9_SINWO